MDIEEKIARAKPNSWVVDNMSKTDIKWESRDYNFTIRSLNEICEKLGLNLLVELEDR